MEQSGLLVFVVLGLSLAGLILNWRLHDHIKAAERGLADLAKIVVHDGSIARDLERWRLEIDKPWSDSVTDDLDRIEARLKALESQMIPVSTPSRQPLPECDNKRCTFAGQVHRFGSWYRCLACGNAMKVEADPVATTAWGEMPVSNTMTTAEIQAANPNIVGVEPNSTVDPWARPITVADAIRTFGPYRPFKRPPVNSDNVGVDAIARQAVAQHDHGDPFGYR